MGTVVCKTTTDGMGQKKALKSLVGVMRHKNSDEQDFITFKEKCEKGYLQLGQLEHLSLDHIGSRTFQGTSGAPADYIPLI